MFEYIRKNQNETQEQNIPQELAEKVVQETTQKSPNKFDLNKSSIEE